MRCGKWRHAEHSTQRRAATPTMEINLRAAVGLQVTVLRLRPSCQESRCIPQLRKSKDCALRPSSVIDCLDLPR